MASPAPLRLLWPAVVLALLLAGSAEAKRFKRYPDDVEKQKPETARDSAERQKPARTQDAPPTPEAKQVEPGEETGQKKDEEQPEEDDQDEEPEGPPGLLGYFLHGRGGLKAEYIYTGETFTNMRGGIATRDATKYLGLFNLAVTGKLDEMGLFPGGTVFLLAEDSHGRGLTEQFVGDQQVLSNIDPGRPFTQVSEYWWERKLLDEFITVRLGKQDANAEFAVVDLGGDFVNSSFGLHHNIPMPAWPNPAMGVVTLFQLSEPLAFKAGVFDGAADGRTWGFSGTGETFSIYEFEANWGLLGGRLPGDFHVGMWYHSGAWDDVARPGVTHSGNHGVHLGFDQLILKESWEEEDQQGLGLFAQYGWAAEDRNDVPNYVGGGLVYKGLFPNRDDDVTGIGAAHAIFSPAMPDRTPETVIELFHKVQWSEFVVVQPDLQYIVNPGGTERDAFAFGLRFEVVF